MRYWDSFESTPLEADGIKAKSQRGEIAQTWWGEQWTQAMEGLLNAGRLRRGRRYARQGQVLSIKEIKGGVEAEVQGSSPFPYTVAITLSPLSAAQWEAVLAELVKSPLFVAQLLAGEMPSEIESAFEQAGVNLFPKRDELKMSCTCPDPAAVCKHAAATHYLLAERFDEDPFLLMRMRGKTVQDIMKALKTKQQSGAPTSDMPKTPSKDTPRSFDEAAVELFPLEAFWSEPEAEVSLKPLRVSQPSVPIAGLKRAGQPDFIYVSLPKLFEALYWEASEGALEWAAGQGWRDPEKPKKRRKQKPSKIKK